MKILATKKGSTKKKEREREGERERGREREREREREIKKTHPIGLGIWLPMTIQKEFFFKLF